MNVKTSRISLGFVVILLVLGAFPASEAGIERIEVGVAAERVDSAGLPPGAKGGRMELNQFTREGLGRFDALVLDAPTFETVWSKAPSRSALQSFVDDHRILVVEGDAASLARVRGVVVPMGMDTPSDADGTPARVARLATAFYRTAGGAFETATFAYGTDADFEDGLGADAARWILSLDDFQPRAGSPISATAADSGNWQYWGSASYSYTWNPYGRIEYQAKIYYAISDGSTAWDWWNVEMSQHTYPGTYLWGNLWHTNVGWVTGDQNHYVSTNELVDWGPGSIDSTGRVVSASFEVGLAAGVEGAPITSKQSFGYAVEDMLLTQGSSSSNEYVWARHEFGYDSMPAKSYWVNKPAWTVRVDEGRCLKVPWQNKVEWRYYTYGGSDEYYTSWINSWREVCK